MRTERLRPWFLAAVCLALLAGCKTMEGVTGLGADLAASTGFLSASQAESIKKTSSSFGKAFSDFTPEQEYYLGRAVGASILAQAKPSPNESLDRYLNRIGQTLARASDRPQTFGGYHFLLLDTEEINAMAAPGGLIFVSKGALRCCRSEDEVAAILAHEIGHVQYQHGLRAIKKGRMTEAFAVLASEGARQLSGQQLDRLTSLFEGSVKDITTTLINSGYSRAFEKEADQAAVALLARVGYNPHALIDLLEEMEKRLPPDGKGWARTHPAPQERIAALEEDAPLPAGSDSPVRLARFQKATARM